MAIDRMDWHYDGDFPDDLPDENGGTHIGMYLAWIINNDLIGKLHLEESQEAIERVKAREITGRDFLVNECDEKFWEEDLDDAGFAFTEMYYADEYANDYAVALAEELPTIYHVEDSWENYDFIASIIDRRYSEWKKKQTPN